MISRFEYSPWDFWTASDVEARTRQRAIQTDLLAGHPGWALGEGCFISELASVENGVLQLGDRTYVAAGAYLTGSLQTGRDCSMNPYTVIRGNIQLGDAVRIGAHTSILGFNHTMADTEVEFFRQPMVSRGILIGDDVWIGSHVVILDGVTVGNQSVLAAGAVVTKDVPAGAIVGGNPAKFLRWRVEPAATIDSLADRLSIFADRTRAHAPEILERSFDAPTGLFRNQPNALPTVRAQCDAIEIADLLLGTAPPQLTSEAQVDRLGGWQDPASGAIAELQADGSRGDTVGFAVPAEAYHVLCVGYALQLLGSQSSTPLSLVTGATASDIVATLSRLPWAVDAWNAGHYVDALGTALHFSHLRGDALHDGVREALIGWLLVNADPKTGMWGTPSESDGLICVVNGFYRVTRGTFAQYGLPLPYPERVIDTVLQHAADDRFFAPARQDACNVLDVAHPLWLTQSTGYRSIEVAHLARRLLGDILPRWSDGAGFSFAAAAQTQTQTQTKPSLQGTEMWLATIWYLADLVGLSESLKYCPRGVHRPEPQQH